jgi:hypothetical protein
VRWESGLATRVCRLSFALGIEVEILPAQREDCNKKPDPNVARGMPKSYFSIFTQVRLLPNGGSASAKSGGQVNNESTLSLNYPLANLVCTFLYKGPFRKKKILVKN